MITTFITIFVCYILFDGGIDNPISFMALLFLITPVVVLIIEEHQENKAQKTYEYNKKHHPLKNLSKLQLLIWEELFKVRDNPEEEAKVLAKYESWGRQEYDKLQELKKKLDEHMRLYYGPENWYSQYLQKDIDKYQEAIDAWGVADKKGNWIGIKGAIPDWHVSEEERKHMLGED